MLSARMALRVPAALVVLRAARSTWSRARSGGGRGRGKDNREGTHVALFAGGPLPLTVAEQY